jgi:mannose-6-phosphate isomerase-like protein (cupin superfamily)
VDGSAEPALRKVSLNDAFASFDERWSPKILASVGEYAVKAVKIDGPFVWHEHAHDDEVFFVLRGGISMHYRRGEKEIVERFGPGELLHVPKGVMHCPVADEGTEILLFERESLVNTGNVLDEHFTNPAERLRTGA